jgi:hypothetical protein
MTTLLTKITETGGPIITETGGPIIIAALIALFGALISAIIALSISRRASYLSSVTAERSKWIDKLRANISELAGLCTYLDYKTGSVLASNYFESPEYDEMLRQIEKLSALIRLQLNPEGLIDRNIIEIVEGIVGISINRADFRFYTARWLLIRHSQWLLKEEWETVKSEAAGSVRRLAAAVKRWRRERAYESFCTGDGSLADLYRGPSISQDGLSEAKSG